MWTCSELSCELTKLLIAAFLGGVIGFEREAHGQAAGLRTNVLVCTGACLLMMLSLYMPVLYREVPMTDSVIRLDPARIASYAIASMGFLGAGAIISGKGTVKGLTTAASIWLVTGIGLAIGAGFFLPALTCVVLSLLVLYGFRKIKPFLPRDEHTLLTLVFDEDQKHLEQIVDILTGQRVSINFINYYLDCQERTLTYKLRLQAKMSLPWNELLQRLQGLAGLQKISKIGRAHV